MSNAKSNPELHPYLLNGALARMVIIGIMVGVVAGIMLSSQQEFLDRAYDDAVASRALVAGPVEFQNDFWKEVADPKARLTRFPALQTQARELAGMDAGGASGAVIVNDDGARRLLESGIIATDGSLSKASRDKIARIRSGEPPTPLPLPPSIDPDDPAFHRDAYREFFLEAPYAPAWIWAAMALVLYPFGRSASIDSYWRQPMGRWLGINWIKGGRVRRTLIAILYAPVFVPLLVWTGVSRAFSAAWNAPARTRAWWKAVRNPYRKQIRKAERALAELRALEADPEMVRNAEEILGLWRTRHETEASEAADSAVRAERDLRMRTAREALLRLDADAVADGIRRDAGRAPQRTTSGS